MTVNYPKLRIYIWAFSLVVFALVSALHYLPTASSVPEFTNSLPLVNACLNGTCFLLLISSLMAVKRKNIELHQRLNTMAMLLSVFFLAVYVTFHYFHGSSSYGGDHLGVYLFILLTHILLAGISLPFILLSYARGLSGDVEGHRKMVKKVYPIWLYVTFTGVMVYLFMAPYYEF